MQDCQHDNLLEQVGEEAGEEYLDLDGSLCDVWRHLIVMNRAEIQFVEECRAPTQGLWRESSIVDGCGGEYVYIVHCYQCRWECKQQRRIGSRIG